MSKKVNDFGLRTRNKTDCVIDRGLDKAGEGGGVSGSGNGGWRES